MDCNDLLRVMKNRRSVRKFTSAIVSKEDIMELIEAGTSAPSGSNIQSWVFGIVDDPNILKKIFLFSPGLSGEPQSIIVACSDLKLADKKGSKLGCEMAIIDLSMATQNIILLASAKGIGTCVVKSFNKNAVKKILELPDHISPELIITLGYPSNKDLKSPKRKELNDIIFNNNWGK